MNNGFMKNSSECSNILHIFPEIKRVPSYGSNGHHTEVSSPLSILEKEKHRISEVTFE
jgi:hypothetical protein